MDKSFFWSDESKFEIFDYRREGALFIVWRKTNSLRSEMCVQVAVKSGRGSVNVPQIVLEFWSGFFFNPVIDTYPWHHIHCAMTPNMELK